MDLLEHQAKELFADVGLLSHLGLVVDNCALKSPNDLHSEIKDFPAVVKAQVKVGGRGKAGGVRVANNNAELERAVSEILAIKIKGHRVNKALIEKAANILEEHYLSLTFDRSERRFLLMYSAEGGVEIEELAKTNPNAIQKYHFTDDESFTEVLKALPVDIAKTAQKLWHLFVKFDATLAEINPLARVSGVSELVPLDAKVSLDDNAKFRQGEIFEKYENSDDDDEFEVQAKTQGLAYVHLDGDIGIIGNGAGLVMSTLDNVALNGGRPANFLDIGGGASSEHMKAALKQVLSDQKVKTVLINIFGGLTQCDLVADGILLALNELQVSVPLVVRFAGNSAEKGLKILKNAENPLISVTANEIEAAKSAVNFANVPRFKRGSK